MPGLKLRTFAPIFTLLILTGLAACSSSDDDPTDPGGGDRDTTPPTVVQVLPSAGTLMIHDSEPIMVSFDDAMDPASSAGQVTLSAGAPDFVEWGSPSALNVILKDLPQGERFTLTIGTGFKDVAGNSLQSPVVFEFGSWSDVLALFDQSPADGATDINRSSSVVLDFVDRVDVGDLNSGITIDDGTKASVPFTASTSNGSTWILDPVDDLPANTLITVTIGTGIVSEQGVSFSSPYSFSFTTNDQVDNTPPTIVSIDPPTGSTLPANQTAITFTFSEPINPDTFKPSSMNGQLWWLIDQAPAEPSFDGSFTVLTVPLPADLPAGLELEAVFVDFADLVGNVQTTETPWDVAVAGAADPYPVFEGMNWFVIGEWAEGDLGSETPNFTGDEWLWYAFAAHGPMNQWQKREYRDPNFTELDYYEIQEVNSSGTFLRGFAENDGGGFQEIPISGAITVAEFPPVVGKNWSSNGSVTIPGEGTIQVQTTGSYVARDDLVVGERDGIMITWTGAWQLEFDVALLAGGNQFSTDHTDFWVVPGVGIVRERYREENSDPQEMYWYTYDRWLEVEQPAR